MNTRNCCQQFVILVIVALTVSLAGCSNKPKNSVSSNRLQTLSVDELIEANESIAQAIMNRQPAEYTADQVAGELKSRWPTQQAEFIAAAARTQYAAGVTLLIRTAIESGRKGDIESLVKSGIYRDSSSFEYGSNSLGLLSDAINIYVNHYSNDLSDTEIANFVTGAIVAEPRYRSHVPKMLKGLPASRIAAVTKQI
jgi:outer membrane murein-binding lipoprotein Lpp